MIIDKYNEKIKMTDTEGRKEGRRERGSPQYTPAKRFIAPFSIMGEQSTVLQERKISSPNLREENREEKGSKVKRGEQRREGKRSEERRTEKGR